MKKLFVLIGVLILIFSISTVSGGLFGLDTIDCEDFSVEIPEGFEKQQTPSDYQPDKHSISLTTGLVEVGEHYRNLKLSIVPLEELPNTDNANIVDDYNETDLKVVKCQVSDDYHFDGDNVTYAEFDKEGKHFYLIIESPYDMDVEDINLNDDVKMIKEMKESLKLK
ncbi:hypothetical protein [Methanobrevibacter sp.]|uniref:hypothetical protein n=1 Tax=Methanobrevibacter sp. TaxID=66852 RepID=UPI0038703F1B